MEFVQIVLMALGLAMDAFAVSICQGLRMKKADWRQALVIGIFFGGFQALMPILGWLVGSQFQKYITEIDHWVAFVLLVLIGGKMIFDGVFKKEESGDALKDDGRLDFKMLTVMAVATSIDALAVGVTFSFIATNIWLAVTVIGVVTLLVCFGGVFIGHKFGDRYKSGAEICGGLILILIGTKILLEHLGILVI